MNDVVVVGGGPAGLAAGVAARRAGREVVVLEAAPQAGGNLRSELIDDGVVDWGPTTMRLLDPVVHDALDAMGALPGLVAADPDIATRRRIVWNDALAPVPGLPWTLAPRGLIGVEWLWRLLAGALSPPRQDADASVADFVRAQLGPRVLANLVDPFLSGVYAGDPERLLARLAIPDVVAVAERGGGSLLRGALARKPPGPRTLPPRLVNFRGGMQDVARAASRTLGSSLRCGVKVRAVVRHGDRWRVETDTDELTARKVILAAPAHALGELLAPVDRGLAAQAASVVYADLALVAARIPESALGHVPPAFGFLVPRAVPTPVLGVLFTSCLFPGRAPEGERALTLFVGGRRGEGWLRDADDEAVAQAARDLIRRVLRVDDVPWLHVRRIPKGIGQLEATCRGFAERVAAAEASNPGLVWASNAPGGVALPQAIARGWKAGLG